MNELEKINETIFESIKHVDEDGNEYWYARELQKVLEYKRWDKFYNVIESAQVACSISNNNVLYHFSQVGKMIYLGKGGQRKISDYKLSRYACYLIAQNGDSRKKVLALAQTYFAIQTRKQELLEEEYNSLTEDEKRIYQRNQARKGNYNLNKTAVNSGVKDLARFHNAGYKGLYNGETANDIAKRKGLCYREDILDNMGSDEPIANLFRISQTNQKLINDNVQGEGNANEVHYKLVRKLEMQLRILAVQCLRTYRHQIKV